MSELVVESPLAPPPAPIQTRVIAASQLWAGWRLKLGWGVGGACFGAAVYAKVLFLGFLVDYAGVAPALAASMIALSNLYDAVIDPLIGVASDRTRTRWGGRAPYMLAASIGLPLAWVMMFNLPPLSPNAITVYVFAALLLYSTAYGGFSVPYNAIPAEITSDYHARSTLMVIRTVFNMVGTTAGGYLAPTLIARLGGGRVGHSGMALAMGGLTFVTGMICVVSVARYAKHTSPIAAGETPKIPLKVRLASVLQNKPFLVLMLSHFLAMTGVAMMNSGVVFYVRRVLKADDLWLGQFYLWMNAFMFASLPVVLWMSRRIGKRYAFMIGAAILGLAMWDWRFAQLHDPYWVYLTRTFFTSFGSAAVLLTSAAMLPDTMEYDRLTTGLSRAGVFSGFYTTVEKATAALGVAVSGFILAGAGYVQSSGKLATQSKAALDAVTFTFATAPGVLILASAAAMIFYKLGEKDLNRLAALRPDRLEV